MQGAEAVVAADMLPITYVRFGPGENQTGRSFPPMAADHPMAALPCIACGDVLAGQATVLVALGPGSDPEAVQKASAGRWFNAVCVAIHEGCSLAVVPPGPVSAERQAEQAARANRLKVLSFVQWGTNGKCPVCEGTPDTGHRDGCEMADAMKEGTAP